MNPQLKRKLIWSLIQNNKDKGFTLIELLCVLIMILCLSALAWPVWWYMVIRTRNIEGAIGVSAIANAQQAFFLANGQFTNSIGSLGIGLSRGKYYEWRCDCINSPNPRHICVDYGLPSPFWTISPTFSVVSQIINGVQIDYDVDIAVTEPPFMLFSHQPVVAISTVGKSVSTGETRFVKQRCKYTGTTAAFPDTLCPLGFEPV